MRRRVRIASLTDKTHPLNPRGASARATTGSAAARRARRSASSRRSSPSSRCATYLGRIGDILWRLLLRVVVKTDGQSLRAASSSLDNRCSTSAGSASRTSAAPTASTTSRPPSICASRRRRRAALSFCFFFFFVRVAACPAVYARRGRAGGGGGTVSHQHAPQRGAEARADVTTPSAAARTDVTASASSRNARLCDTPLAPPPPPRAPTGRPVYKKNPRFFDVSCSSPPQVSPLPADRRAAARVRRRRARPGQRRRRRWRRRDRARPRRREARALLARPLEVALLHGERGAPCGHLDQARVRA